MRNIKYNFSILGCSGCPIWMSSFVRIMVWGLLLCQPFYLYADDLRWAREESPPPDQAPEGLRNNFSIELLNAIEGLFQPRFQRYFRDNLSYYIQLQFGTHLGSSLYFFDMYKDQLYNRLQLGLEFGLASLLYARRKVTKGVRPWGSGMIFETGFRFMFHSITDSVEDIILNMGPVISLGWQLQSRNFSIGLYLQLRILLHFSIQGQVDKDFPIIIDRGTISRNLPSILLLNDTLGDAFSATGFYSISQTLNVRISYYF